MELVKFRRENICQPKHTIDEFDNGSCIEPNVGDPSISN